ncbi:MAG: helix-turn-helix domain-containing protein [Acidobacteria bacterium]|nr:helix-turn-helix domain-containing protein [Acidobacteriota bacterium]
MEARVQNQVAAVRKARGVSAAGLARRAGVSRQTIYAIEAGTYVPNTEVTLRLARELEVSVEALFSLQTDAAAHSEAIASEVLSPAPAAKGQPVQVCRVGEAWVSIPVSAAPYFLPEADGVITKPGRSAHQADLLMVDDESLKKRLILAGCDPATNLLARMVEKICGVEIIPAPASSKLALSWLRRGKVHIAGSHLQGAETEDFNLPYLKREFPGEDFCVFTFARWEEGLVVAPGNPKHLRKAEDLARRGVQFANREPGSGSRTLLDQLLHAAGVPARSVHGYDRVAFGHLAAAYQVVSGEVDCCLATRSAAQTFGLDFVPLRTERYDLVLQRGALESPPMQSFLDVLQRAALRRKLEILAGYDTSQTGAQLA